MVIYAQCVLRGQGLWHCSQTPCRLTLDPPLFYYSFFLELQLHVCTVHVHIHVLVLVYVRTCIHSIIDLFFYRLASGSCPQLSIVSLHCLPLASSNHRYCESGGHVFQLHVYMHLNYMCICICIYTSTSTSTLYMYVQCTCIYCKL